MGLELGSCVGFVVIFRLFFDQVPAGAARELVPVPGGFGVLEGGLAGTPIAYGAPSAQATAAVIIYHALAFWIPSLGGLIGYALLRRRLNVTSHSGRANCSHSLGLVPDPDPATAAIAPASRRPVDSAGSAGPWPTSASSASVGVCAGGPVDLWPTAGITTGVRASFRLSTTQTNDSRKRTCMPLVTTSQATPASTPTNASQANRTRLAPVIGRRWSIRLVRLPHRTRMIVRPLHDQDVPAVPRANMRQGEQLRVAAITVGRQAAIRSRAS